MRHPISTSISTASRTLAFALGLALLAAPALGGAAQAADEPETPGALVGASFVVLGLDLGLHSGDAALANAAPPTKVEGAFGMIRVNAGVLLRVTRFGAEAGLEGSFGLGWIGGGAYGGKEEGGLSADLSAGVVVVPLRTTSLSGAAFKMFAGVGSDHDVDYLYAGARLGFGENDGDFGVEPAYTYRVGDAPTGATLTEHRLAANLRIAGFALSVSYLFGESKRFLSGKPANGQRFQEGTLRKGDYTEWLLSLGYAWR